MGSIQLCFFFNVNLERLNASNKTLQGKPETFETAVRLNISVLKGSSKASDAIWLDLKKSGCNKTMESELSIQKPSNTEFF